MVVLKKRRRKKIIIITKERRTFPLYKVGLIPSGGKPPPIHNSQNSHFIMGSFFYL